MRRVTAPLIRPPRRDRTHLDVRPLRPKLTCDSVLADKCLDSVEDAFEPELELDVEIVGALGLGQRELGLLQGCRVTRPD